MESNLGDAIKSSNWTLLIADHVSPKFVQLCSYSAFQQITRKFQ